ncbi:hypothetical protein VTK73DRAFT_5856 [Phialemonium thermophilum]|uniref:Uncharacterized protein n=1 Tax=Phialemonium thermophilum TaxID=223376 RepID=A0ABR3V0B7_9PEZI
MGWTGSGMPKTRPVARLDRPVRTRVADSDTEPCSDRAIISGSRVPRSPSAPEISARGERRSVSTLLRWTRRRAWRTITGGFGKGAESGQPCTRGDEKRCACRSRTRGRGDAMRRERRLCRKETGERRRICRREPLLRDVPLYLSAIGRGPCTTSSGTAAQRRRRLLVESQEEEAVLDGLRCFLPLPLGAPVQAAHLAKLLTCHSHTTVLPNPPKGAVCHRKHALSGGCDEGCSEKVRHRAEQRAASVAGWAHRTEADGMASCVVGPHSAAFVQAALVLVFVQATLLLFVQVTRLLLFVQATLR